MENVSKKIYSILEKIAKEIGTGELEFKVERPKDPSHGDFSTNIALVVFQERGPASRFPPASARSRNTDMRAVGSPSTSVTPFELAQKIVKRLGKIPEFEKIEAVKPGFINFHLSKKYLQTSVQKIISEGSDYGSNNSGKGKKASVEFVSANPTGPLHVGNARGGPLGDTIANVLSKAGYKVTREYLHNNVGGQIEQFGQAVYYELHPDQKPQTYVPAYQGEYLKELAENVEEELQHKSDNLSEDKFIEKVGETAVEIMLVEIIKDCQSMGIKFDRIVKESNLRKQVAKVLPKLKSSLKEKEGALWFSPNDEFLKDRETVVQKSNGQYTYFASDIAYHDEKMSQNDVVIDILGANHSGHVPRLQAVIKALNYDVDKFKVVLYQWIRLKRGSEIVKMSKRAGNFVSAKEVLEEVGKDAFRFFLLMQNANTHMDFDLELAKKKASENPVFYVQYAYTRICSIFSKYSISNSQFSKSDLGLLKEKEEIELMRKLVEFPELVQEISQNLQVNLLANYSLDLASLFHKFYEKHQVVSKDEKLTSSRLALLDATQITLKNTLDLLGVSAPEKM